MLTLVSAPGRAKVSGPVGEANQLVAVPAPPGCVLQLLSVVAAKYAEAGAIPEAPAVMVNCSLVPDCDNTKVNGLPPTLMVLVPR